MQTIETLIQLVTESADAELVHRFTRVDASVKQDGSLITEADMAAQERIRQGLQAIWPQRLFLGEEMDKEQQAALLAQSGSGLWVLDPLDGTRNFAAGIPFFSVSLALIEQGEVTLGIVYDPMRRECFYAVRGQGAWMNGVPIKAPPAVNLNQATAIIDFKRLSPELSLRLAQQAPYSSQRSFGSVALDWCWIALGRGHVYLHGKQNLWDFAAGELILLEAGGFGCTLQGEPVYNGRLEGRSAVAAGNRDTFDAWCHWLGINCG